MHAIENETADGKMIYIDERYFINCKYTNCTLIYTGGDFGWEDASFIKCKLQLEGSASRVMRFLRIFGVLKTEVPSKPITPPTSTGKPN